MTHSMRARSPLRRNSTGNKECNTRRSEEGKGVKSLRKEDAEG